MKCKNIRESKECGGELIKLKSYYVCTECCSDITTFEEVVSLTQEDRGAYSTKPKHPSIEILHPELSGFYTYEITYETEYFSRYTLYGQQQKVMGSLHMEDYSQAEWVVEYKGPTNVIYSRQQEFHGATSLTRNEIKFYPKKPIYKKKKKKNGMDFYKEKRIVKLTTDKNGNDK